MATKKNKPVDKYKMPQLFFTGSAEDLEGHGYTYTEEGEWEWANEFFSPYNQERRFREYIYIHGAARIMEISVNEIDPETGDMLDVMDMGCYAMTPALFLELGRLMPKMVVSSVEGMHHGFSQED